MDNDDLPSDEAFIAAARAQYASDDIEIDAEPQLSHAEEGVWVQAWVWVSNEEARA
ncbi:hypothetical protein [Reyranella sp.]|uniref:hypothetical protein n=1 Tax=Reyranella sp. TaxID=1929291 RepID=UPI0025E15A19|nr:hypothetical protein [Reyranella sp.]